MPLKYLFTAIYKNGETYEQNPEDKSLTEPEKRSCFYDINHDELVGFVLKGQGHQYGVDLRDGHFEIDGVPFRMHEDTGLSGFKLIFFRQHTHSFNQKLDAYSQPTQINHTIVYRLGWQCTIKGKNYQQIMQID